MNFKEVQRLLKMMNVDMNEDHALRLFQVSTAPERLDGLERDWKGWNKLYNTSLQKDLITFFNPPTHPASLPASQPTICLPKQTHICSFIC